MIRLDMGIKFLHSCAVEGFSQQCSIVVFCEALVKTRQSAASGCALWQYQQITEHGRYQGYTRSPGA